MAEVKIGAFDELDLMIVPTDEGRKIVNCNARSTVGTSKDGRIYENGSWKVTLFEGNAFREGMKPMFSILYKGKNALSGSGNKSRMLKAFFDTGSIRVYMKHYKNERGRRLSRIAVVKKPA